MLEKVNRFSKSHFAKKKFPVYITNFKRNRCTDLIKFWASCSIITGRAANITVLINTTTPPLPQQQCSFCVMCFTTEKLKLNLWSLIWVAWFSMREATNLLKTSSVRVLEFGISGDLYRAFSYCDNSYISMYVRPNLISKQTRLKLWFYAFEATINWITYHGGQFEYVRKTLSMSHKKNLFENNSCPRLPVLFHLHRPLYATT